MAEMTLKEKLDHARKYGIPKAPKAQAEATRPKASVLAFPGGIGLGLAKADRTRASEIDEAMESQKAYQAMKAQAAIKAKETFDTQQREREELVTVIDGVKYEPIEREGTNWIRDLHVNSPTFLDSVRKYNVRYYGYDPHTGSEAYGYNPFRVDPFKLRSEEDY